ncbi:hypothetical protein OGAPHI_001017 [Ogataea philodendri]|uniref:Uncharacterized protein n=1 Tax=Ogataea philodendri TaxID=1378263 RepID=A0A9P8PEG2_9ASCO|nr:uncharacterized protein OGAPHI_001017 [Ogataea philodendri]KAH3670502.1 hypothetical protein OGAPHI_001017 [Ogataea philodendri]
MSSESEFVRTNAGFDLVGDSWVVKAARGVGPFFSAAMMNLLAVLLLNRPDSLLLNETAGEYFKAALEGDSNWLVDDLSPYSRFLGEEAGVYMLSGFLGDSGKSSKGFLSKLWDILLEDLKQLRIEMQILKINLEKSIL